MIRKSIEKEARKLEARKGVEGSGEEAVVRVREVLEKLGIGREEGGGWRGRCWERNARSVVGWEEVEERSRTKATNASVEGGASTTESNPPRLYRLQLPSHNVCFPLTASLSSAPVSTSTTHPFLVPHSLHEPISLLINEPHVKHLHKGIVFEADLQQLVFVPTILTEEVREIWIVEELYRVMPSFCEKGGESQFRCFASELCEADLGRGYSAEGRAGEVTFARGRLGGTDGEGVGGRRREGE